ncbi:hypothetical protein ACGK9U_01670 [Mariniflexile sp. HNIBRBA6329]|uniref:hypothetical protein n=1 Tax=Mariniflexile sp. HNIBRBA6329 TaxID=3373088 RepID=UPI003744CDCD
MENFNSQPNHDPNIFNQIRNNLKNASLETKREHPFNKKTLWNLFICEYRLLFSKPFLCDAVVARNIEAIFYYFLESEEFFNCQNLRSDISAPSFNKGLLLFGNVGVGKTHIMRVFESIFKKYPPHRFTISPTYEVVDKYEAISTRADKDFFYQSYTNGTILFDDLNSEKIANNYGSVNIMKELIIRRCDKGNKTHLTMNPLPGFENDIDGSLLGLGDDYDQRTVDRFYEMFNVIQLTGKSIRR